MSRLALPLLLLLTSAACAHLRSGGDIEALKPTIEGFHRALRWKDFRAASDRLVPERRAAFTKARLKNDDDRDLFVTDFQLEDAQVASDRLSATVVSKLTWYRLPSSVEQRAVITTVLVWRDDAWQVESQDDGPFVLELAPAKPSGAGH
jgi:hypothetical protein